MNITELKGIGAKTAENFNRLSVYTVSDLVGLYPRDYDVYHEPVFVKDISHESEHTEVAVEGHLWEMMHRRWDIEENGFHQLKTYYHAKHCYCRDAVETIFNLIIIGFNVRELYLYRRSRNFAGSGISRKSINRIFCDDLLTEKVKQILCEKGG